MTGFKGIPFVWDCFLDHFIFLKISLDYIVIETNHIFLILGNYLIKTFTSLMNERYCEEDVVQRLALSPHSKTVLHLHPGALSVWSLHVVSVCGLYLWYFGSLPVQFAS